MHHIHLWCCSCLGQVTVRVDSSPACPLRPGTTHRQEKSWKLCGAPVTHYVKQWCTIPSQKLSVVFHTLLISIPHSLQPDTRETSHSKLKEPSEELKTVLPCSPDKTGGRRSDWHRHCWTAASSDRHVMGPSHERLGRRAVFLAPGVSSFPRKQISQSSVVFWQPVLRPALKNGEVPSQELAPGLFLARHAKTAPLRQLLIHSTARQWPFVHTCATNTCHPKVGDASSDLPGNRWFSNMEPKKQLLNSHLGQGESLLPVW